MADNLNAKSPKPTEKTKITNAVNRTTSETMRLGEPEKSVNHPTSLCTTTTKERKKTPAFQITSVTVGPRISNDGGDDSADDLDESHTDDISDVIDNSRITDIENETPSYSEDTFSKEEVFFNASNASLGTAPVIPTSSQYGLAIVGPEGSNNSQNPTVPCANNITNSIEVNTTSVSDSANGTINIVNSVKPSEADMRDVHTHTARNERFKVVKIESTEPFKRGRWMCMDYLDHSVVQQQSQQAIIVKGVEQSDAHTGSVQYVGPDSGVVLMDGLGVDHPSDHQNMQSGTEHLQQPPQMTQVTNLSASQNVPSGYSSSVSPGQTLQQMSMGLVQQPVAIGSEMPPHAQSMSQVPIVGMVQQQPPTMGQSLPPQQMQTLLQGYQQSNYYPSTQHLASQASSMPVQNQSLVTSTAQQMSMQGSLAMSAPQPHLITQPQFQTQHTSPQFQATHLQQAPPQLTQPSPGMQGGPQPVQMNQPIQVSQSLPNQQIQVQVSQPMQPQSIQVQVSQPMQAQTQPAQTSQSMQVPSQPVPVQSSQSIQIPSQIHIQNQPQTVQVPLHMQPQPQPVQIQQQMQNVQVTQIQGQSQSIPISQMQPQTQPIQSQSTQIQGQTQSMSSQSQTMQGQSHSMNPQSQQMQAQQMQAQSLQQQMQVQSQPVQISQQLHQQSQPVQMSQMQPQSQPVQVSQQVQAQSQPVQVQAQMQSQTQSVSQHVQHMQQVQVSQMQSQPQNIQVPQMQNQSQSVPVQQHQMQAQSQPIQVPAQIQPQSQTVQMPPQIQQHSQPVSVSQHMPVQSLPVSQPMQSQPMGIPVQQVPAQSMQQLHVVGVPQPMMTPTSMSAIPTTPLPSGYVSAPSGVTSGVVEMAMHPEPVQESSVGMQQEKVVGGEAVQPGPAGDDNPASAVSDEPESVIDRGSSAGSVSAARVESRPRRRQFGGRRAASTVGRRPRPRRRACRCPRPSAPRHLGVRPAPAPARLTQRPQRPATTGSLPPPVSVPPSTPPRPRRLTPTLPSPPPRWAPARTPWCRRRRRPPLPVAAFSRAPQCARDGLWGHTFVRRRLRPLPSRPTAKPFAFAMKADMLGAGPAALLGQRERLRAVVVKYLEHFIPNASGTSAVAIDNKIEQAMDLVKSHLMFAVREEVEVLKERIAELMERINQLELENTILKAHASQETLAQLGSSKGAVSASATAPPPTQQTPSQQAPQGQAQQGAQVAAPPAAGGPAPNMV